MFKQFRQLISQPKSIVEIVSVNPEGTVTVESLSGQPSTVIGTGTVGQMVYIQDGRVLGDAPSLPYVELEV